MPKPLPRNIYRIVEGKLHNEASLHEIIRKGRQAILTGTSSHDNGVPSGHSKHSDPTAVKGMLLSDGTKEMRQAQGWIEAIDETRAYFAKTAQEQVLTRFYGRKIGTGRYLQKYKISKSYFQALRDDVVTHCAMQAMSRRLIWLEKPRDGR